MLDLESIFDPDRMPQLGKIPDSADELQTDWRLMWDERAAICQYDGGLSRKQAEDLALAEIREMIQRAQGFAEQGSLALPGNAISTKQSVSHEIPQIKSNIL